MTEILAQVGATIGSVVAAPAVQLAGRLVLGYILIVWLGVALWIFQDCRRRVTNHIGPYVAAGSAILATPVLVPLVLIVYRLVRPARTVDETAGLRLNALVAAASAPVSTCPGCAREADEGWRVCPFCSTELREPCERCARMLDIKWAICPFCADELRPAEELAAATVEAPARPRRRPRAIRPTPLAGAVLRPREQLR